tara:strand:+ start:234 stop:491 length:258 start_codon:yes stop_codon:yes gene_type:complete
MVEEKLIGKVSGFFSKISVAAIELEAELKVGDMIHIKGHTTDFEQKVDSIQIMGKVVEKAGKGDSVGIKVVDKVREHDIVYLKED